MTRPASDKSPLSASPPPHNLEAERAVLGSMLLDRDAIARAVEELRPEDFYLDAHRVIFTVMLELFARDEPVDLVLVNNRINSIGKLEDVGGATYIASLPNATPTAANVDHYMGIVCEKARSRAILGAAQRLQRIATNGADPSSVVAEARLLEDLSYPRIVTHNGAAPSGESLLHSVGAFLSRFVVFASRHQQTGVSLWVLHTHSLGAAEATPYLAITSAEKQSGKSRLLEVLEPLVPRPWLTIRPSEAVLFRTIAAKNPILLLDEVDAIFNDKVGAYEGHRALLNAGHRRGAMVSRCVGDKNIRLEEFPVFCAKALAGIGNLPDTVADRSIPIRLLPRKKGVEHVERFRARDVMKDAELIRGGLVRWAKENLERLSGARPEIPSWISDRAADGWEPLLAIADLAGGDWPRLAREAAVKLHGDPLTQEETVGVALLRAIKETFEEIGADRITTSDLLSFLVDRDDGPWAEWWGEMVEKSKIRGPAHKLGRYLGRFVGSPRRRSAWTTERPQKGTFGPISKTPFPASSLQARGKNLTTSQRLIIKAQKAETRRWQRPQCYLLKNLWERPIARIVTL